MLCRKRLYTFFLLFRVCPCKLDFYSPKQWIANISLSGIDEPDDLSQPNLVTFEVKALGDRSEKNIRTM